MPARAAGSVITLMLALACASPLQAREKGAPPPVAAMPAVLPADAVQAAVAVAQGAIARQDCAGVLAALDPILPELVQGEQRILVQRMRLVCLGVEGRSADLPAVQSELAVAMPRDGLVRAFGVLIAADESRFVDAAEQIAVLADTAPRSLDVLTGVAVRAITIRLTEARAYAARGRMLIALARADWAPSDLPELRASFAEGAIGALVDQGQVVEAEGLLDRIEQPEMLTAMLIDRQFTRIWPAIETRLGPAGGTSVDRFARDKLALYGDSQGSESALRDAANAMLLLGRYQDVLDLTDGVEIVDEMSRDAVRTTLYRARAFAALKRNDEADRLFAEFLPLDLRRSPEVSSVLVSYAEFLDEIGWEEQALSIARTARSTAGDILTNFGKRWLDRTEICALAALGRSAEANAAMDALKGLSAQNMSATIEALLCTKRDSEASRMTVTAFENKDAAGDLLIQFQPAGSVWVATPSRLRGLWSAFLTRPEIRAAFERKGRILPRAYWPAATPRPIPRRPAGGTTFV